jgi:hypothetical protein
MNYLVLYNKPLFWECWIRPFRYPARIETLARIIHECRREAFETEARLGFSHVRLMEAYWQSVEEAEREKPRRARGSDGVAGIHE